MAWAFVVNNRDVTDHDLRTRRVGVVVNPERDELAGDLISGLTGSDADLEIECAHPETPGDLGAAVDSLVDRGVDVVAAVGGDGTQRAVAARLAGTGVALAVVPGGTVNLLGRVLGIDGIDDVVAAVVDGDRRTIDAGSADGAPFFLNASTGWDAAVIDRVDDRYKRFGRIGYLAAGVFQWARSTTHHVTIALDGDPWYDGDAMTVVVLNAGQRGSESLSLVPDARLDDGRLDVLVLRRDTVPALARSAWSVLRGEQPTVEVLMSGQGTTISVDWDVDVDSQRDGDADRAVTAIEYRCDRAALTVCVPSRDEPGRAVTSRDGVGA